MYKMTDRSLYGARPPFAKVFAKEEKLDGMSEDELAKRVGITLMDNSTDCNCGAFETEIECEDSGIGCIWRPLFESCHPPELIDGSEPICSTTEAPTMSPTISLPDELDDTQSPTTSPSAQDVRASEPDPWYTSIFKSREHDAATTESNKIDSLLDIDDDEILEPYHPNSQQRRLAVETHDTWYNTDDEHVKPSYDNEILEPYHPTSRERKRDADIHDAWYNIDERIKPSTEYIKTLSSENRVLLIETVLEEQEAEREYKAKVIADLAANIRKGNEELAALQRRFGAQSEENDVGFEF